MKCSTKDHTSLPIFQCIETFLCQNKLSFKTLQQRDGPPFVRGGEAARGGDPGAEEGLPGESVRAHGTHGGFSKIWRNRLLPDSNRRGNTKWGDVYQFTSPRL